MKPVVVATALLTGVVLAGCSGAPVEATTPVTTPQPAVERVSGPALQLFQSELDLGVVPETEAEIVAAIFFSNVGDEPLEIRDVTGPCSCFSGYTGDQLVAPGADGLLEVYFDTDKIPAGDVTRTVDIESNSPDPVEVTLTFTVERDPVREEVRQLSAQVATLQREIRMARRDMTTIMQLLQGQPVTGSARQPDTTVYDIAVGSSPVLGPEDAPVTIVEFTDLQCPYCVREYPMLQQVREAYPDQVRVVFKHFPLPFHDKAKPAHAAVQLALNQGGDEAFWKMHDLILGDKEHLDIATLRGYAEQLGLDLPEFDRVVNDEKAIDALLKDDLALAGTCNVKGTPTIFVNGLKMQGRSFADYQKRIDELLGQIKTAKADPGGE